MPDISEDEFFAPELEGSGSSDLTKKIVENFKEWTDAEEQLAMLTEQVDGLNAKIGKIRTVTVPDLLKEMGTEIWRDPDTGIAIELELAVNAALPKDQEKRNAMLDALRPIGVEEIMAEEFTVTFSPNDRRAHIVRALLGLSPAPVLEDDKPDERLTNHEIAMIEDLRLALQIQELPAEEKLGVHAARLKAWLKERIEKGFGKTVSDAGIWYGKHAKIVKPKKPRAKKGE